MPGAALGTLLQTVNFAVKVFTGDVRGNGTDGDLAIKLVGDKGQSNEARVRIRVLEVRVLGFRKTGAAFDGTDLFTLCKHLFWPLPLLISPLARLLPQLWLTGASDLMAGASSTSTVALPDVGRLSSLVLRLCDNSGSPNSQLYVSRVEVLHTASGLKTVFPLEAWIAKSEDGSVLTAEGDPQDAYINYEVRSGVMMPANQMHKCLPYPHDN